LALSRWTSLVWRRCGGFHKLYGGITSAVETVVTIKRRPRFVARNPHSNSLWNASVDELRIADRRKS
jgi:hypothetical protein